MCRRLLVSAATAPACGSHAPTAAADAASSIYGPRLRDSRRPLPSLTGPAGGLAGGGPGGGGALLPPLGAQRRATPRRQGVVARRSLRAAVRHEEAAEPLAKLKVVLELAAHQLVDADHLSRGQRAGGSRQSGDRESVVWLATERAVPAVPSMQRGPGMRV